jgi:large subunit ribosomal protein L30e
MNEKKLQKVLRDAVADNKLRVGSKEVLQYMKGTKLVVLSNSLTTGINEKIKKTAEESNIPIYNYPGNSILLGRLCNLSFRTSAVSLRNISDEEVKSLL